MVSWEFEGVREGPQRPSTSTGTSRSVAGAAEVQAPVKCEVTLCSGLFETFSRHKDPRKQYQPGDVAILLASGPPHCRHHACTQQ